MNGQYHLITFGCQMNDYDSRKIEGILSKNGLSRAENPEDADVILLNTCSIRDKAENKVFSKLGRLAEMKMNGKNRLIALGGCMASLRKEEIFRRAPMVDVLFGPDNMERLPALIQNFIDSGARQVDIGFSDHTIWDGLETESSSVVGQIGIMKGCDNRCTYCVVPYTRGPEISRPPHSILAEARSLSAFGCKELMLIGQNVNSYGKGLGEKTDFTGLLRMVEKTEGIERIRFMTSHPKDLNDTLIAAMSDSKKICPSLHLPVQAGSDKVLSAMKRNYTVEEYMEKVSRLKKAVPGITISTDIMTGFPGETEEDFNGTLEVMRQVGFDALYLFNYSTRPGTTAGGLADAIPREVSQSRFERAHALHGSIMEKKLSLLVGTDQAVLCEGLANGTGNKDVYIGRTGGNHLVFFKGDASLVGHTLNITISRVLRYNLEGVRSINGK